MQANNKNTVRLKQEKQQYYEYKKNFVKFFACIFSLTSFCFLHPDLSQFEFSGESELQQKLFYKKKNTGKTTEIREKLIKKIDSKSTRPDSSSFILNGFLYNLSFVCGKISILPEL